MKKQRTAKLIAVILAVCLSGAITVYAAYDSTKDPLVSLSYLTDIFKPSLKKDVEADLTTVINTKETKLTADINAKMDEISKSVKDDASKSIEGMKASLYDELYKKLSADYQATIEALQNQVDALSNNYEFVSLKKGNLLIAKSACEIVVLEGSSTVRSADSASGIIDCTDGLVLYEGQNVPVNHKLMIPEKSDSRGIVAVTPVTLLVKGGYTIGT